MKDLLTSEKPYKLLKVAKERGFKVPPAWKNLWINANKDGALQVRGTDTKGRVIRLYNAEAMQANAEAKFNRLKEFTLDFPKILKEIEKELETCEEAKVLYVISKTGMRVGSERDRQAKVKAYGVSTLTSDHVTVKGSTVIFDFTGKKGVTIHQEISDKKIVELVKAKDGKLFNTNEDKTLSYLKRISGKDYLVKDFRTYIGTSTAIKAIKSMDAPTNQKEYVTLVKKVCQIVADKLGNTPTVAKESYIAPEVFDVWEIK